ncbi:hypothetical protein U9M48_026867 [Paspalum notatum var. saurae]|uniref:Methyltransferase family protein n=1 Tax=Paspalum notatum var. saurae TaxID=547442 RepID=A0AAQ3WZD9_PASNO
MEAGGGGGGGEEEQVMSEVHLGCPPHFSGLHVSRFSFSSRPLGTSGNNDGESSELVVATSTSSSGGSLDAFAVDEDGDLVLDRRKRRNKYVRNDHHLVTIQHRVTSSLKTVGLQVWKAALLLADFVLHKSFTSSDFDGVTAIEMGAGTGLVGQYLWSASEIEEAEKATVLFTADVIYSDELTDLFFDTVNKLMSSGAKKVLYLALEKRYNFSLDELDVVANGYAHFRSFFAAQDEHGDPIDSDGPSLMGKQINLAEVPQYIREYDRGKDLEMWKIMYFPDRKLH